MPQVYHDHNDYETHESHQDRRFGYGAVSPGYEGKQDAGRKLNERDPPGNPCPAIAASPPEQQEADDGYQIQRSQTVPARLAVGRHGYNGLAFGQPVNRYVEHATHGQAQEACEGSTSAGSIPNLLEAESARSRLSPLLRIRSSYSPYPPIATLRQQTGLAWVLFLRTVQQTKQRLA